MTRRTSDQQATPNAVATREYPEETITSLDHGWRFGPYSEGCEQPDHDDSALALISLPHTVTDLTWDDWDPASWERTWIYRLHFDVPSQDGARYFLDFDGAMTNATPSVNGQQLGEHLGGYLPFTREITDIVRPGENLLAVVLDSGFQVNVPPNVPGQESDSVDYWQPGGLYRGVRLRTEPAAFIADVSATPRHVLDRAERRLDVEVTLDAAATPHGETTLVIELRDGDRVISSAACPAKVEVGATTVTTSLRGLDDITLWDTVSPRLYTVAVTLVADATPVHSRQTRTGFREAVFRNDGFYLNGRRLQLFGVNRHQHYPYAGFAMPDRVQRKDAELLRRELNCNMVRCSHYPQSPAFLDACDELGLMVWEEPPGWVYLGDDEWKERACQDVAAMIRRDRNHPSIIIWGVRLNETADDVPLYSRTQQIARDLDDSRQTAGAMAGRLESCEYLQDVFAEDDYASSLSPDGVKWPELDPLSPRTDRPYLITETVGTISGPAPWYRRIDAQRVLQGQAVAHARMHNLAAADERFCGVLTWSGIDYESRFGPNIWRGVKYTGVVDLFRVPKPGAAIYQAQVDPMIRPVIAPAFYWDFGPTSPVTALPSAMICSNLTRLEIFVGGEYFATVRPDTTRYGNLKFPPSFVDFSRVDGTTLPELRIDGYLGDSLRLSRTFSSDPGTDLLSLVADDAELIADGVDTTRVEFRAVDAYGAPRPCVEGEVELSVSGPADLIGESPFPFATTGGAGAVWIRTRPGSPGIITVRASHRRLGTATVVVRSCPQDREAS